jgi:hypothetical protein
MFHTYGQKGSQKTKCYNIKYNYYRNIVFIDKDDSQRNGTAEDSITPRERTTGATRSLELLIEELQSIISF